MKTLLKDGACGVSLGMMYIRRVFINGRQVLCDGVLNAEALKTTGQAMRAAAGA